VVVVVHPRHHAMGHHLYVAVVTTAPDPTTPLPVGDHLKTPMNAAAAVAAVVVANHVAHHPVVDHHLPEVVDIARTHPV